MARGIRGRVRAHDAEGGVSGAGTAARPKYRFCWACSRKLHGNFHRVVIVDGLEAVAHVACAKRDGLVIKQGAHLAPKETA